MKPEPPPKAIALRRGMVALPVALGVALVLTWRCSPPEPDPRTVLKSPPKGARADAAGLTLQVAHVVWTGPKVPRRQSVDEALESIPWQGPGASALQQAGEAKWPGMGFKVVKVERFPVKAGGSAEFRSEPRLYFPIEKHTILWKRDRFTFQEKANEIYRITESKDGIAYDDGKKGQGVNGSVLQPLPLDLNQLLSITGQTPQGVSSVVYACYRDSAQEGATGGSRPLTQGNGSG